MYTRNTNTVKWIPFLFFLVLLFQWKIAPRFRNTFTTVYFPCHKYDRYWNEAFHVTIVYRRSNSITFSLGYSSLYSTSTRSSFRYKEIVLAYFKNVRENMGSTIALYSLFFFQNFVSIYWETGAHFHRTLGSSNVISYFRLLDQIILIEDNIYLFMYKSKGKTVSSHAG